MKMSDRLKLLEKQYDYALKDNAIIRIDGHKFSKFTKGIGKFNKIFADAMVETTKDLFKEFHCYTGYTGSDEITLFIPKDYVPFSGRIQKLASLTAGYASTRFNYWLKELGFPVEKTGYAYFDSRAFSVPDVEVFNVFLWRNRDVERNSKMAFAQELFSHKELIGVTANEAIEMAKTKKNKDWNGLDDYLKYGTFVKKELFIKETENGPVERSRIIAFPCRLEPDKRTMIYSKYYERT